MKAFNATASETLLLTEGSRLGATVVYKVNDVATDISGGAFKMNLLDKEGGSILDAVTVTYTTDGTDGSFDIEFEIAELAALLAAYVAGTGALPAFWELFFSSDGTAAAYKIWMNGPVKVARSGS
jgi:hypothetical protein